MLIYLSGPMSGLPDHNFPAFHAAAKAIRAKGHTVINPAELDNGKTDGTWEAFLARDLRVMMQSGCDTIALLPGWHTSRGANLELHVARALDWNVLDAATLQPYGQSLPHPEHPIIGLCGPAKVGKDTIHSHLSGWSRAAFADALKADLLLVLHNMGLDLRQALDKATARPLLVEYGRLGRKLDPDYWIKRLFLPPGPVCITDVRYWNEVKWITSQGGQVFLIERDGIEPANVEEQDSLNEIRARVLAGEVALPRVHNVDGYAGLAASFVQHLADDHAWHRRERLSL